MSRPRRLALMLPLLAGALTPSLDAQQVGVRIGAGPAVAGRFGVAGLLGVHLRAGTLLLRADARAVTTSEGEGAQFGAKVGSAALAVGWTSPHPAPAPRPYVLGTVGSGLDVREADAVTTLGAVVGLERLFLPYLFGEVRYEYWIQNGVEHYDLPGSTVSMVVGICLH